MQQSRDKVGPQQETPKGLGEVGVGVEGKSLRSRPKRPPKKPPKDHGPIQEEAPSKTPLTEEEVKEELGPGTG